MATRKQPWRVARKRSKREIEALDEAIRVAGPTQEKFGKRFGVSGTAIQKWKRHGVPLYRVRAVSRKTGIPNWKLRPDVYERPRQQA